MKNWNAALQCYQIIIDTPNLSEDSLELFVTHSGRADVYLNLNDLSNALLSYEKALQLQCQYHSSKDLSVGYFIFMIGCINEMMGNIDAALKSYQDIIKLDQIDFTYTAHQYIGKIYMQRNDHDTARRHLIKSL
ncbi:unnamed protein product [Rotaria magnacalcarata]|uniref:Tetratricopeptide repeat protein n=1 Tax=Rotaria magnacalcarata TaxID=392030 RepID=A0A816ASL0_9BILA|nr:unnamed protein product [Rotaria magnacalcarata]CAF1599558.1 unnamed protein product [Rotaria magnacalcarata]CAF2060707.1 unnamed protein product [Rotaria magnacalcarata]CAF3925790.1 unnamed protein product [Rotaria magnacalcarata]CAF4022602.1 unnamed protein product [Rotaria magnacalcarata]